MKNMMEYIRLKIKYFTNKYKRAKKKFVKKRVYKFEIYQDFNEELIYAKDEIRLYAPYLNTNAQILKQISMMPMHKAFWKAREVARKDKWKFFYTKKVKI